MSRDHYIAKTYLKHFGDDSKGGMLNAYRKSDGAQFPCWPDDVCHEWDGDLNSGWLKNPALLGEFRKLFEPKWNVSIESALSKSMTDEDKLVISGYMANLMTCTPTWRRICIEAHDFRIKGQMSFAKRMKEKHGGMDDLPVDAIELIEDGSIEVATNPDYIKARITRLLMDFAWATYNQEWEIISNDTEQPFITSDNPVAFGRTTKMGQPISRLLPLSPRMCLSVRYDQVSQLPKLNMTKRPMGTVSHRTADIALVRSINRAAAQNAEELVFSPIRLSRIGDLVKKYANYRVVADNVELSDPNDADSVIHGTCIDVREAKQDR